MQLSLEGLHSALKRTDTRNFLRENSPWQVWRLGRGMCCVVRVVWCVVCCVLLSDRHDLYLTPGLRTISSPILGTFECPLFGFWIRYYGSFLASRHFADHTRHITSRFKQRALDGVLDDYCSTILWSVSKSKSRHYPADLVSTYDTLTPQIALEEHSSTTCDHNYMVRFHQISIAQIRSLWWDLTVKSSDFRLYIPRVWSYV